MLGDFFISIYDMKYLILILIPLLMGCSHLFKPEISPECKELGASILNYYTDVPSKLDPIINPIFRREMVIGKDKRDCYTDEFMDYIGWTKATEDSIPDQNVLSISYINCEKHSVITFIRVDKGLGIIFEVIHPDRWDEVKSVEENVKIFTPCD